MDEESIQISNKKSPQKGDIVQQIQSMYSKRTKPSEKKEYLIPTKATLFGLDVRFRHIDQKIAEDKAAKSLSKLRISNKKGTQSNRHNLPKHINPTQLFLQRGPRISSMNRKMKTLQQSAEYTTYGFNQQSSTNLTSGMGYASTGSTGALHQGSLPQMKTYGQKPNTAVAGANRNRYQTNGNLNRTAYINQSVEQASGIAFAGIETINSMNHHLKSGPNLKQDDTTFGDRTRASIGAGQVKFSDDESPKHPGVQFTDGNFSAVQDQSMAMSAMQNEHGLNSLGNLAGKHGLAQSVGTIGGASTVKFTDKGLPPVAPQNQHSTCYDELIKDRMLGTIPKNKSFVRPQPIVKGQLKATKKKIQKTRSLAIETQSKEEVMDTETSPTRLRRDEISKCQKSQLTQLINKIKTDQKIVDHKTKIAQQAEQLAERQKMFKGISEQNDDSDPTGNKNKQQAAPIQVIKKATIFDNAEYKENLKNLERQARSIQAELKAEQAEERQTIARARKAKEIQQERAKDNQHLKNEEMQRMRQMKEEGEEESNENIQSLLDDEGGNNMYGQVQFKQGIKGKVWQGIPPDEFLFGDDIKFGDDSPDDGNVGIFGKNIMKEYKQAQKQLEKAGKVQSKRGVYSSKLSQQSSSDANDLLTQTTSDYPGDNTMPSKQPKSQCAVKTYKTAQPVDKRHSSVVLDKQKSRKSTLAEIEEIEKIKQMIEAADQQGSNKVVSAINPNASVNVQSKWTRLTQGQSSQMQGQSPDQQQQSKFADKKKEACLFPKTNSYLHKEMHVDVKKLMQKGRVVEQLTKDEREQLRVLKESQLQRFRQEVDERFDSTKNWSIMIDDKHNNMRNEVMKKVKFEQLKRRCLHDFMRKAREDIVSQRIKKGPTTFMDQEEECSPEYPEVQERNVSMRNNPAEKDRRVKEYKRDFLDFVKMKVTQEGAAQDMNDGRVAKSNSNNLKLPKRTKSSAKDSVEDIAQNLHALINFSRDQSQRMRLMKKINTNQNKNELMGIK